MTFVSDAAQQLLSCFDTALQAGPNPPPDDNICLRVGQVPFDVGLSQDLCCEGFAWVRVLRIDPASTANPRNICPTGWDIELEMGTIRCLPFGDESMGPSCSDWTSVFLQVDEDASSMRRALCCVQDLMDEGTTLIEELTPGTWTPIDGQGGCIGGSMPVTIRINCSEC